MLASEQRILGVALLGTVASPHIGICLGTACRLTSEPGLRQSSHPQPLTVADVGERERSCRVSGRKTRPKCSPHLPAWGAVIVKFYVNFVRLWFLVVWSNTSLDIAMKIFWGSDLHLKSVDFK